MGLKTSASIIHPDPIRSDPAGADEYLTIAETAALLRSTPKTVANKMASGIFRLGIHYFRPHGFRPLFKRRAIIELIEGREASGLNLDPRISFVTEENGDKNHARGLQS
jgi:hypothetical protein